MRDHVAICFETKSRIRLAMALAVVSMATASCAFNAPAEPIEILSANVALDGARPATWSGSFQRGVYLIEAHERDIDARVKVTGGGKVATLEDKVSRHGVVSAVVSLENAAELRLEATSVDHQTKRGTLLVRVRRFARDPSATGGELERGYVALQTAAEISARDRTEEWSSAADKLYEAVSHFEQAGDEAARARAAYTLAYVQYGPRDQYAAAMRACETATEAYRRSDDEIGVWDAATLRGAVEIQLASAMSADTQRSEQRALFSDADKRLAGAAEFFERRGLAVRAQYAVNMRAVRAAAVGEYDGAARLLERAAEMAQANADVGERAKALANLAAVHVFLGQMTQAAREYEALMPLIDRNTRPYQFAGLLSNYGAVSIALGDFDRALALKTDALQTFSKLGEEDERAVELAALGELYLRMGDNSRALETLKAAIEAHEKISDAGGLTATLRLAGNAASLVGKHDVALDYLRHSARIDANPHGVARTNVLIAGELRMIGQLDAARSAIAAGLASSNPLVRATALEERAQISIAAKQPAAAIDDLRAADAMFAELGLEMDRIDVNTTLSHLLLERADIAGATAAADSAIAIVGRLRVKSANPEWRARFLSSRYSPYEARIAAELARGAPDAPWRSFLIAEAVRARSLTDEMQPGGEASLRAEPQAEAELRAKVTSLQLQLESSLQKGGADSPTTVNLRRSVAETKAQLDLMRSKHGVAALGASLPDSLSRAQAAVPKDAAVIAFYVGDLSGYAWMLSHDGIQVIRIPGRQALEKAALATQDEIRGGIVAGPAGRQLSAMLFGSLLAGRHEQRLLLLPDGPLNSVPFAALPIGDGTSDQLVDRFTLASAPSLSLALSAPKAPGPRHTRVAVISDPVYAADDRRLVLALGGDGSALRGSVHRSNNNLTRLPYSALEASAVENAFGARLTTQLSGFDAVPSQVLQLPSRELSVLHFATHAVAHSDSPEQSALFLTEYARDGSLLPESRITAGDIARSGLRADIVVLSGCSTGEGRALRGEGVLGLTYGFLANGSNSVVASLWPIEDASTARFMNEFYRAYRESGRAADALRSAQLRTRASTKSRVWSSFVVRARDFP